MRSKVNWRRYAAGLLIALTGLAFAQLDQVLAQSSTITYILLNDHCANVDGTCVRSSDTILTSGGLWGRAAAPGGGSGLLELPSPGTIVHVHLVWDGYPPSGGLGSFTIAGHTFGLSGFGSGSETFDQSLSAPSPLQWVSFSWTLGAISEVDLTVTHSIAGTTPGPYPTATLATPQGGFFGYGNFQPTPVPWSTASIATFPAFGGQTSEIALADNVINDYRFVNSNHVADAIIELFSIIFLGAMLISLIRKIQQ